MSPPTPGWSLRRRLGRVFVALVAILLVLAAVAVFAAIRFAVDGNAVIYKWQPAAAASQRLFADLVNQETGVRGYVLTRQQLSLKPYTDYVRMQRSDTARIHALTAGDKAINDRLAAFNASAAAWERDVARPLIRQVERGGHPDTSGLDAGRAEFDRVRARAAALGNTIAQRVRATQTARTRAGIFAGVALGLTLLLVLVAGLALWRGLGRWVLGPMGRLAAQTRQVASGAVHREIVPDGPVEVTALGGDVEGMRAQIVAQLLAAERAGEVLRAQGDELARSNADLQQFAYVASHDLSEPLRKVANFCQLLERQYAEQLDDRAREYIGFAVDGAKRMQTLIGDLLEFSRVGRTTDAFVPVDLNEALEGALATLSDRIADSGAVVERPAPLPTVAGDRTLLRSLFENLVGNAVKYRREGTAPVVRVTASEEDGMWTFEVRDDGIGIDPQYAERIFAVFQRLHLRDAYGGTGIGLALCRKIVEFHGGRIWLEDVQSGPGASFRFTLPEGGPVARPDH